MADSSRAEVDLEKAGQPTEAKPPLDPYFVSMQPVVERARRVLQATSGHYFRTASYEDHEVIDQVIEKLQAHVVSDRERAAEDRLKQDFDERLAALRRGWYLPEWFDRRWKVATYLVVGLLVFGWIINNEDMPMDGTKQVGSFFGGLFWPLYVGGKIAIGLTRGF